ncbi:DUF805 domain-containing protein [uncultured Lactococcus sp.]|uniref:DUF805 domain-containing protein n=1 Tax=uncultured Lactococcus sp. TaxID=167973 RepID=UPI0027DD4267|nr:DUF805 domain-containing protein [uncultured Lactococcus sp.]
MLGSYRNFWKKYVDFESCATRTEWWWVQLCNFIVFLVLALLALPGLFMSMVSEDISMTLASIAILGVGLIILYSLAILIPSIALNVRRLRDAGYHWAMIFINFVPYVGSIAVFVLLQMPSKRISDNDVVVDKSE